MDAQMKQRMLKDFVSKCPRDAKPMVKRFPPGCTVSATGIRGTVISYHKASEKHPEGALGVLNGVLKEYLDDVTKDIDKLMPQEVGIQEAILVDCPMVTVEDMTLAFQTEN